MIGTLVVMALLCGLSGFVYRRYWAPGSPRAPAPFVLDPMLVHVRVQLDVGARGAFIVIVNGHPVAAISADASRGLARTVLERQGAEALISAPLRRAS
jgi:hypothetical protein